MIITNGVSLAYGARKLFEDVNINFTDGNCYGIIGANGAGKSTLLKILAGVIKPTYGQVILENNQTISLLKQDHFQYEQVKVLDTVMMGHERLFWLMKAKEALYQKPDFSEEDGHNAAILEAEFASLSGWDAEVDALSLLEGLGIASSMADKTMSLLQDKDKIKVLLAQALFGKPHNLLLDEPTNHLDASSIRWLENYILDLPNTVIVVSHDRHFLNTVCTHMVDIDFAKANLCVGNYDFWQQSSKLARDLKINENKKKEDKALELEAFIRRFSANASKSRQATSRRKQLEKLTIEDLPSSMRKRPSILFTPKREAGDILLEVSGLSKTINNETIFDNISFNIRKGQKVIFISDNDLALSMLFAILMGQEKTFHGEVRFGVTTSQAYLPKDHSSYFDGLDLNLIDWLRQYSEDKSENFIRTYLGRMLFSGEETLKKASVLSGGEKVRCMLAKMMLSGSNVLVLDGPTNHLDLDAISALNEGLLAFTGTILFTTHDQELALSLSDRVIELKNGQLIDHKKSYRELIENNNV